MYKMNIFFFRGVHMSKYICTCGNERKASSEKTMKDKVVQVYVQDE
jgi:hypothetical protein